MLFYTKHWLLYHFSSSHSFSPSFKS